ncbi:MAG: HAD-IIA family hydrolase [Thermoleophilia bacterium]|jgi:HAD superfamily hydrolase (TIGR01450 family)|nr:HAD-IIA family hydrolase [Thermoleophilia bacterium]
MELTPLARAYRGLVLDLDGCVWVGDAPIPGSADAIAAWRADGRGLVFMTNDPRSGPEEHVRRLWAMGVRASADEVVSAASAVQAHLAAHHRGQAAFVVGTAALVRHVAAAGLRVLNNTPHARRADVVVVAGHEHLTYAELRIATQAVLDGAALIGPGRDATIPMPDGPWPGSGAVLAAVEYATGRTALTLGKPHPGIYRVALERLEEPVLAVGDRLDSDVAGAAAAGIDGALVLSGATSAQALAAWTGPAPVASAGTLAELLVR